MLNISQFGPVFPSFPGSVGKPCPGYDIRIVDECNNEVKAGVMGNVVIKKPLPPSFMTSLWGNDKVYVEKYLTEFPGYYSTADMGLKDDKGYFHIMARSDDVIKPAGHRISTGSLEEVINEVTGVVESAAVGVDDDIRGELPFAFVVLKDPVGSLSED